MLSNFKGQLIDKKELAKDILWLRFLVCEPNAIDFTAGQYVIVKLPQVNDDYAVRLYSICSPDFDKNHIELLIHLVPEGKASMYFANLQPGNSFAFQAPAGIFVLRQTNRDKIFLATGTGISPIRSMILSKIKQQTPTTLAKLILFWGLRTKKDVYFFDEFQKLARQYTNFSFKICLSREDNLNDLDARYFSIGWITANISSQYLGENKEYYLCGDPKIILTSTAFLKERNIPSENIFCEKF